MEYLLGYLKSPGPIILNIGPFSIRWYGLLIALSVLIGLNLSKRLSQKRGIEKGLIDDLLPYLIFASLIGARIYYVIFEWSIYKGNLFESFAIWKGGIAIHGALIGALISIWIFCLFNKQYFWDILDILVPSFALGQSIGRWGNFFNNEAFGLPTNLPWKIYIPFNYRPIELVNFDYFHPTFLYESLWNLAIFILLMFIFKKVSLNKQKIHSGSISIIYLTFYSIGRLWIEGLRIDPLCINALPPFCEGGIRVAQLASILLICLGIIGLRLILKKPKKSLT